MSTAPVTTELIGSPLTAVVAPQDRGAAKADPPNAQEGAASERFQ